MSKRIVQQIVPVPHIPKQIVEVILGVVVRLQRHERQHGWTCKKSKEQIVEVIKVILQELANAFFLLIACGKGAVGGTFHTCCPTAHPHTRGLILSASDGIWNMLFSTCSHTSRWVRFRSVVVCLLSCSRSPNSEFRPFASREPHSCRRSQASSQRPHLAARALGSKKAESAHVFASRAFVTVTLAANTRGGMWTQTVYEGKTYRVHPHGPLFPRQLMSHFRTHWITQETLLDMIDAIDADMHARPGDAEQRNFIAYRQPLDRAHMRAFKSSIRGEVAKHFAEFFLEAESNFERANLDSSTSQCSDSSCSYSCTAAAQNADSPQHRNCWLALYRLEGGGAA